MSLAARSVPVAPGGAMAYGAAALGGVGASDRAGW